MYKNKQKKLTLSLVFAVNLFILSGCSSLPLTAVNPNTATQTNDNNKTEDLKFTKVSTDQLNQLNSYISRGLTPHASVSASAYPSAAPLAVPSAAATGAPGSGSSNMYLPTASPTGNDNPSNYYPTSAPYPDPYPVYTSPPYSSFGDPSSFEQYTLIDFEEARKDGFTGSYLSTLNTVINPIIKSLASDARLISTYGNTDGNGKTIQPSVMPTAQPTAYPTAVPGYYTSPPTPYPTDGYYTTPSPDPYYNPYQWQFTYTSSAKKEVYSILVSSTETLILKQQWGLLDLSPQNIKIDSTAAIEIVKKAVRDKNTPDPQPSSSPDNSNGVDVIYDIPETAAINYDLEKDKSDLEWNINFSETGYQEPNTGFSPGYARVNAITGELIYFHRMIKYSYNSYTPTPYDYYTPTATPSPYIPTAAVTAQPTSSPGVGY